MIFKNETLTIEHNDICRFCNTEFGLHHLRNKEIPIANDQLTGILNTAKTGIEIFCKNVWFDINVSDFICNRCKIVHPTTDYFCTCSSEENDKIKWMN